MKKFAVACQAQFHNITPIVGLPLPLLMENIQRQEMMAPIAGWQKCVQKLSDLVAALKTSARESDIVCLDFYHPFLDKNGDILGKYYLEDGLHPNKQGHRLMAEKAVDLLCNQFHFNWKFNHIERGDYEINTTNCRRASTPLANTAEEKA